MRLKWIAVALWAGALIACGTAVVNPVSGETEMSAMSEEQEVAEGAKAHQQVLQEYSVYDNPAVQSYVNALGQRLADDLGFPFIELSREIEHFAGCQISEIHNLYGANAYRRYERRALEEAIQIYPEVVIATPGGLVSDSANFNLLLSHCTTVWLQADAADHMDRVAAQGDMRPMAASREAMEDLKRILEGRSAFYSKADLAINTSGRSEDQAFEALRTSVRQHLTLPV